MAWLFPARWSVQELPLPWQTKKNARGVMEFDVDAALDEIAALRALPIDARKNQIGVLDADISQSSVKHRTYWRGVLAELETKALDFERAPQSFKGNLDDLNHIIETIRINLGIKAPLPKRPNAPIADDMMNPHP